MSTPATTAPGGSPPHVSHDELAAPAGAVADSMSVAVWTVVSRATGVLRIVAIAAVLGATYFANTYQFTNSLPNLIFFGLLAGSLFSSLLVPALVRHIDTGDAASAARTAGGLLGVTLIGAVAVVPLIALITPVLLRLGAIGASQPVAAHSQARIGAILILLFLPQVPLYAVVGTCTAVMNAHRKFALAAAAPALENLGTIAVLGVVYAAFARSAQQGSVPLSLLLLLGIGTTGAVALHASVQWWGARRVGVLVRPRAGWRDPEVRVVIKRALPAAGQAALVALQVLAMLVLADRIAGGVVAFQLALNFYFLPIAIGAGPVAIALVPRLARMNGPDQQRQFRDTYLRGLAFAAFLIVPASMAYAVLARPLAEAVGYGRFGTPGSEHLIAVSLLGLALGILGETLFMVATFTCYARHDVARPLRGMLIQTGVVAAGLTVTAAVHGPLRLTGLGLSFSAGSLSAAGYLLRHLRRSLPAGGGPSTLAALVRALACAVPMAAAAWATAWVVDDVTGGQIGHVVAVLAAVAVGAASYLAAQAVVGAAELAWLEDALRGRLAGHALPRCPARLRLCRDRTAAILRQRRLDLALLLGCAVFGGLLAVSVKYAVVALLLAGLSCWVLVKPQVAAYLLILLTPLIVGLNTGKALPVRPNEALIVLFAVLLGVRWLCTVRTGDRHWPRLGKVDISLLALGLASSVLPLLMMVARQRPITSDDLLYSFVLWKLIAEYVIVRSTVRTREQAMVCLWLSLISAAVICAIGILQSLNLLGVQALLAKYYAPLGQTSAVSIGRGSSLLALPAAVADLAILNLAIAIAMIIRLRTRRSSPRAILLIALALLFVLGVVAAAEFSTIIGLVIALVVLVALTKSWRLLGYALPVAAIGAALLWPVISMRLSGFQSAGGIPLSWATRLNNLRTYFWPQLFSDNNWILGVRPDARVAVPSQQYGYVWIESGYTWLLWGGGIPLLGSYLAFAIFVIRKGWAYAKRAGPAGVAGTAITAFMASQVVMMLFDPHLTYRGSGDAFFLVLALVRVLPARRTTDSPGQGRLPQPARLQHATAVPRPACTTG